MFQKQRYFLLSFLFFVSIVGMAAPIDSSYAKQIATRFLQHTLGSDCPELTRCHLTDTFSSYIFNFDNGFVIVAKDDSSSPIMGYSNESSFQEDAMPPLLQKSLQNRRTADVRTDVSEARKHWQTLASVPGATACNRSLQLLSRRDLLHAPHA